MAYESFVTRALDAMKTMGINENRVKPELDKLRKLYNNDWQLIEEDNFRILANLIFEEEEDNMKSVREREEYESERPLKRQHALDSGDYGKINAESYNDGNEKNLVSPKMRSLKSRYQENDSATLQAIKEGSETNENSSLSIMSKSRTDSTFSLSRILASTSSLSGEVKILLSCKMRDGKEIRLDQEELFRVLEEKNLKSYKLLYPTFSVNKVLEEVCECALELATEGSSSSKNLSMKSLMNTNVSQQSLGSCSANIPRNEDNRNSQLRNYNRKYPQRFCDDGPTKGLESYEISWVSKAGKCPFFNYIIRNFVFEKAAVKFTLSNINYDEFCKGCAKNCVSQLSTCGCTVETGHEFAYTSEGLLKLSFLNEFLSSKDSLYYCSDCPLRWINGETGKCKGHPKVKKFIKECYIKCGCHIMHCINRVIQRGIQCKLQVFYSSNARVWGLRTLEKLQKGTFICEYVGEILTIEEWFEEKDRWSSMGTLQQVPNSPILLDAFWFLNDAISKHQTLCLDATYHGNVSRFVNYRPFGANLIGIPVKMESSINYYYHVGLFTTREIDALEELTWDYGSPFNTSTP